MVDHEFVPFFLESFRAAEFFFPMDACNSCAGCASTKVFGFKGCVSQNDRYLLTQESAGGGWDGDQRRGPAGRAARERGARAGESAGLEIAGRDTGSA